MLPFNTFVPWIHTAFDQDSKTVKIGSAIPGGSSGSSPQNLSGRKLGENSARSGMSRTIKNRSGSMVSFLTLPMIVT